ncbi:hypothetical protein [Streptomyces sp. HF10]|uniref:hypothetical protein n=1 Tax=Streptomyces sp. HF10 TaxID=2692233 RepID=UPI001318FE00|nr:hypothetical protein [Streptomyces sp. HF10]QHC31991.1 hypothetical protein GR129_27530 [Streptomyces sp. HF10]
MRLRDARDQIEREHPELTGTAKIEAIKALRTKAAASAVTEPEPVVCRRHCGRCGQDMKPVEKHGWSRFLSWLALLEFGSVIAATAAAVTTVNPDSGGGISILVLWPAAVHPAWLGIVAAIAAFIVTAGLAGSAGRRAAAGTACPECARR